jgi:hypothetical protein
MRRNHKTEWELWLAVRLLAHWSDNIRIRLANAYEYHLSQVHEEDMPTEALKQKLINTKQKLTGNYTKSVAESTLKWRLKTCQTMAVNICDLYYEYANFEWHLLPAENQLLSLAGTKEG